MPRISKMGIGLIFLGFFLYIASLQATSNLLLLILGIVGACFVGNLIEARHAVRKLKVQPPKRLTGTEGGRAKGAWKLENPGGRTLGLAELLGPAGTFFRVGAIPAGHTVHVSPDLNLPRRGVYPYGRLQLRSSYPFGLLSWSHRLGDVEGEIIAYPEAYPCEAPPAAGFEPMVGGRYHGRNRSSSGDSFHGVRPLTSGDPLRLIHWPSSAKGLGTMVKEFDEELSGRVGILVSGNADRAIAGEALFDWTCRAAASLVLAALDAGHQVEFTVLNDRDEGPAILSVPPFADAEVALEALARARATKSPPSADQVVAAVDALPRKAALVFVLTELTDAIREVIIAQATHSRRPIAVYLPVDAGVDDLPGSVRIRRYGAHQLEEDAA